jgi:protein phosphatase-4 regulatory subunit 3
VDYPDDDDEDVMDTKPESPEQAKAQTATGQTEAPTEVPVASPTAQTPPPERLAEKRRREEEDDDELVKLSAGPKRRSSTSSNSGAGILNRKKTMSIGSMADKGATPILSSVTAAPKRIAINIGSTNKSPTSESDTCTDVTSEHSEKENRDESQGNEGG